MPVKAGLVRAAALVLVLVLAGCAGRPHGILLPVAATVPGAGQVNMLVDTTRARDTEDPAEMFSGDRAISPSFAAISVSIPPDANRQIGEVQWPTHVPGDPARDFVTLRADIIDHAAALGQLDAELARTPHRQVLVFVHGYNNKFKDAVFRFAQIVHDSGTSAAPVLFTWPSRARLLAYGYDRDSSTFSRDELERLLRALAKDRSVGEITILAHSMGNWLTLETLRQMAIRDGRIPAKITTVMLAAPDVDVDVFQTQLHTIGTKGPKFTLFVSQDDEALAISRRLAGNAPRLGAINPEQEPYRSDLAADDVTVFDLTKVHSDSSAHAKFAESPEVVRLIGERLATGQTVADGSSTVGDKIFSVATGAGNAAAMAASAPIAIFDPDTRAGLTERLQDYGVDSTDAPR